MDSTEVMHGEQEFSNVFSDYFRTSTNLESFESPPTSYGDVSDPTKNSFLQFLTADRKSGYHKFSEASGVDATLESSSRLLSNSSWSAGENFAANHNNNFADNFGPVHCASSPWDDVNKLPDFASCSSSADSSISYIPPGGTGSLDFTSLCGGGSNLSGTENSSLSGGTLTRSSSRRKRKSTPTQRVAANIRERRRMCSLNTSFDRLRRRVPVFPHEKKLSRIQTLRLAIRYISYMSDLMGDDQLLLAELSRGRLNPTRVGIPAVSNPPDPADTRTNQHLDNQMSFQRPAVSNPPDTRTNQHFDNQMTFQRNSQTNVILQNIPQNNELWSKHTRQFEIPVADYPVDQATTSSKLDISPPPAYNNINTSTFIDSQCLDLSAMWPPFHNHSLDGGSYQSAGGMFIPATEGISNNNHLLNEMMFPSIDDAYDYF